MTLIKDPRARAASRRTERMHRRWVHTSAPARSLGTAGAVLMLCAAFVLIAAQLSMYPNTRLGEENATSMVAPAAVLAVGGLNGVARPAQAHRIAGGLGLAAAVVTVVIALVNPHQVTGTAAMELVAGFGGIVGASALLTGH